MQGGGQMTWRTPVLTVLTRRSPEETVLNACKGVGAHGGEFGGEYNCGENEMFCGGSCYARAAS
jgi:hypothetical protein